MPLRRYQDTGLHARAGGLGEHADEVLEQIGYDAERIAALRACGAVK